jgi:hypothetical protein
MCSFGELGCKSNAVEQRMQEKPGQNASTVARIIGVA